MLAIKPANASIKCLFLQFSKPTSVSSMFWFWSSLMKLLRCSWYETHYEKISWIFAINQEPCGSSCWGKKKHTRSATKGGNPIPDTIPVTTKKQSTNSNLPLSQLTGRNKFQKSCNDIQVYKKRLCNKFLLCHSHFLEHRPHWRSEEPLRSVASISYQLVDRRANESILQRCVMKISLLSPKEPCSAVVPGLREEPWFKRLGASASTTVTSHTSCSPISQGKNHGYTVWAFAVSSVQSTGLEHSRQVDRSQRLLYEGRD